MIRKITGKLCDLRNQEASIEVGTFEYEVLIPEFVRRQLQSKIDETITLMTIHYIDGNPQKGRLTPRLVGFLHQAEREFFELICLVDGVGVKKALQAMVRPVQEVATAIEEQDAKQLSTLPGIGPAVAERIIAKLRRKMAKFALLVDSGSASEQREDRDVLNEASEALLALGHSQSDARDKIEKATQSRKGKFKSVEDVLQSIYSQQRPEQN
ncbi:helix-hairpin-helix domain-containing protein [Planctomicrobium sp.]|nr:Holliday junction branch migration protein RuvA [Planctomicrobium sp.]MDA7527546.1 helix-hairpin-helix domain-containing protein [bacterium]MBT5017223.1 Holliday junction DNA helicase RuvA [Planctomicrobium sp.]MDB4731918.1 helix-hairpin-helix domain-containing protein [bacterium]MDB4732813.1 helix-hairpin-helix domain-containing protein [Planctomicrobium sp.]MDB4743953.1 helix-hairpin-helix domain-containing protein [Planctomicrobium sp.]